jgi:hypothetical protein
MTPFIMGAEALVLTAGAFLFLTFLGLGITELLLPEGDGLQPLLAPAVGLAILVLGIQSLTFLVPSYVAALLLLAALSPITLIVVWRRRRALLARSRDLIGAGLATPLFFVALFQVVLQRGFFTLGGFPSDNVFIYIQAAQYLRDHPMPAVLHRLSLENPGSYYLVSTGPSFPNSVGGVDAALSVLGGWPVYTLFDQVNALGLALIVGPLWFFVRAGLGGSWLAAAASVALLATNQLLYWVIGLGFQQESLALPIFVAGLGILAHAVRTENLRTGALAGLVGGSLLGLYLPLAMLFAWCALGCVAARFTVVWAHPMRLLRAVGSAVICAVAAASAALYVLLFQGGLAIWLTALGSRVPAGAVSKFPPLPYLIGTLPFPHVWELAPQPLRHYDEVAFPVLVGMSVLIVALLVLGFARAIAERHTPEAAVLAAGLAFVAYEGLITRYPYGFVKSIDYLVPFTSAFIACGAVGLGRLAASVSAPASVRRAVPALGVLALAAILSTTALASRETVWLWVTGAPSLPRSYLALTQLTSVVPTGAHVFIDYPTGDYGTLVKVAAIAYFLPDRSVRVFTGNVRLGTFDLQNVRPSSCDYNYVIGRAPPAGNFELVYGDPSLQVDVYRRLGSGCG